MLHCTCTEILLQWAENVDFNSLPSQLYFMKVGLMLQKKKKTLDNELDKMVYVDFLFLCQHPCLVDFETTVFLVLLRSVPFFLFARKGLKIWWKHFQFKAKRLLTSVVM